MNRCIIICAGERGAIPELAAPRHRGDLLICCDAGLDIAAELGIAPDLAVGDFDSLEGVLPSDVETLRFPIEKDDTDSMLAVREGLRRGFRRFELHYALGGRLDHTLANVQTLAFLLEQGASGVLYGPRDSVQLLRDGRLIVPRDDARTLSVFAYGGVAEGVTLQGVHYPLDRARLETSFPLGLGNHIVADKAVVAVEKGTLMVVTSML